MVSFPFLNTDRVVGGKKENDEEEYNEEEYDEEEYNDEEYDKEGYDKGVNPYDPKV